MDMNQFIARRENQWKRLTALTDKAGENTVHGLSAAEAEEFFSLYRLASSDLNLVQTRGGSSTLLDYLETLVARAYSVCGSAAARRLPADLVANSAL